MKGPQQAPTRYMTVKVEGRPDPVLIEGPAADLLHLVLQKRADGEGLSLSEAAKFGLAVTDKETQYLARRGVPVIVEPHEQFGVQYRLAANVEIVDGGFSL